MELCTLSHVATLTDTLFTESQQGALLSQNDFEKLVQSVFEKISLFQKWKGDSFILILED